MSQMWNVRCPRVPPLILKHLISSVVSLARLVTPSVALLAELVCLIVFSLFHCRFSMADPSVYKMVGKRGSGNISPWEAAYSLRASLGKRAVANLPWTMGLQSPMLRGKKSSPRLPWTMSLQSPMLRGKRFTQILPWTTNLPMLRHKKSSPTLPWKMSLQSPMLRGKKVIPILQWTMDVQSPMLRGKKTKTLMNLPWQMDLKSPMLRGKKSMLPQSTPEETIERPFEDQPVIIDDLSTLLTRDNMPWTLGYLGPKI